jgi:hypothetical protein
MSDKTIFYKGATIQVLRDKPSDDWYILVWMEDGTMGYDGWWRDSAHKPMREAFAQAKQGAQLDSEPRP